MNHKTTEQNGFYGFRKKAPGEQERVNYTRIKTALRRMPGWVASLITIVILLIAYVFWGMQ